MPKLIFPVAIYLSEILENGSATSMAKLSALAIVGLTIYPTLVLVVGVCSPENLATARRRASEVLDVIFVIHGSNIRPSNSPSACVAEQIQTSEVVDLAQGYLLGMSFGRIRYREEFSAYDLARNWEKLVCHDLTAILACNQFVVEIRLKLQVLTAHVKQSR